jgi:DNA repair exonuclease SbcCD nuclease subunit
MVVGDMHLDHRIPSSRIDNWVETINNKLDQLIKIANQYNVDHILFLGDMFNRPKGIDLAALIKKLKELFRTRKSSALIGNHESNSETGDLDKTTLGIVWDYLEDINKLPIDSFDYFNREHAFLKVMDGPKITTPNVVIPTDNMDLDARDTISKQSKVVVGKAPVLATETTSTVDIPHTIDLSCLKHLKSNNNIMCIHEYLTKKPLEFPFKTRGVNELNKKWKLILVGHLHEKQDFITEDGTRVYNPGSLLRNTASLRNHKPEVGILDTDTLNIERVELVVEKSENVFADVKCESNKYNEFTLGEWDLNIEEGIQALFSKLERLKKVEVINYINRILNK